MTRTAAAFLFAAAALAAPACKKAARPPSLGEAVKIEQPGGGAVQLIARGTELPTSATESFTTGKDDQAKLYLHVLRGAGARAEKLESEGWYAVEGLSTAKAGEPNILVTFELDLQGQVSVTARDDERKLAVRRVEGGEKQKLAPAALLVPEDDEDADAELEE